MYRCQRRSARTATCRSCRSRVRETPATHCSGESPRIALITGLYAVPLPPSSPLHYSHLPFHPPGRNMFVFIVCDECCAVGCASCWRSVCLTDDDCTGGLSCTNVLSGLKIWGLLSAIGAVNPTDSMKACGGYASVASKVFTELAHLVGWHGPDGGFPASVDEVSMCLPSKSQVCGCVWL